MSVIDEVRKDREDLARVLKKHSGIRKIVEDLYPDSAHFIYELLQNAEDTGATSARFILTKSSLMFEHNGRAFDVKDIRAITDIGEGTKGNDDDKIGRFGVGFKAVFAYSETPHIWSPSYSFKITELVLPFPINPVVDIGTKTRFEFPFNNPKKERAIAYKEVFEGLEELAETTLLFLSHLESISWQIDGADTGEVLRYQHSTNHFEVLKQKSGKTTTSLHFLKFEHPVIGLEKQRIAVAYALDYLPNVSQFDAKKNINKQMKIVPASPGKVAVFFPAEKETSGLRFHLHAPFVPELSRASIKETPANTPLFKQLSELISKSLHEIRDNNLLSADFLGVLPNPQDQIPSRYECIRSAIIEAMNNEALTPTFDKSHAPAMHLLQARAIVKNVVSKDDIKLLVDYEDTPPNWAVGVIKGSNAERFLEGLDITEWDIAQFFELLCNKTGSIDRDPPENVTSEQVKEWLINKSVDWHQQFCALLYDYLSNLDWLKKSQAVRKIKLLNIIRLSNQTLSLPDSCFFPSDGVEHDDVLPRVDGGIYSSGRSKAQQENAKKFLIEVGVKDVGESEQIRAILETRYSSSSFKPRKQDLKRFVTFLDKNPDEAEMFSEYHIFERTDEKWATPGEVYLDQPFIETGLKEYFDIVNSDSLGMLSDKYLKSDISTPKLLSFAKSVGVNSSLTIKNTGVSSHPNKRNLMTDYYKYNVKWTSTAVNDDWYIESLKDVLEAISTPTSRLIWNTMRECEAKHLEARFRPNQQYVIQREPSTLVLMLREHAWIPQGNGKFVKPAEADSQLLPSGFAFDSGWTWIKAIHFGKEIEKKSEEFRQKKAAAKALGFDDEESLENARRFALLPLVDQKRILNDLDRNRLTELPENQSSNPERRAKNIGNQVESDLEKTTEKRTRSVSVGRDDVKKEAEQYLKNQYTNSDGIMICQICKDALPFKLEDEYYFEKVELFREVNKHHQQNYLALCPNHSAMFQYANGSRDIQLQMFKELGSNELEIVLAQKDMSIYFTTNHRFDLQTILKTPEINEDENLIHDED